MQWSPSLCWSLVVAYLVVHQVGAKLVPVGGQGQAPISAAYPRSTAYASSAPLLSQDPLADIVGQQSAHTSPRADTLAQLLFMDEAAPQQSEQSIHPKEPLVNFEVNVPPRWLPSDLQETSTTVLLQRSFANSYYKPSLLSYSPSLLPVGFRDPTRWTSIVLEQKGLAVGRQFDRLGTIYLGNEKNGWSTEIWRTDNAQPVNDPPGVSWETHKDVSRYFDLFRQEGQLVFDYPNIVDETYTAPLNITLSLTIHQLKEEADQNESRKQARSTSTSGRVASTTLALRSPLIYPISQRNKTAASHWAVPGEKAVSRFSIPFNAVQAIVEIYASGTADDEFWYGSINTDIWNQLPNKTTVGFPHGAYRELRLYIDGILAGAVAPYPVIFTGGINPLMWRPQTGFGSYDQPTYILDVTAFLGILCDGKDHDFEIKVTSAEADEAINKSWFVSGNLQVVLGQEGDVTSGSTPTVEESPLRDSFVQSGTISGDITTPSGSFDSEIKTSAAGRTVRISSRLTPAGTNHGLDIITEHVIHFSSRQVFSHGLEKNELTQSVSDAEHLNTTLDHQYVVHQELSSNSDGDTQSTTEPPSLSLSSGGGFVQPAKVSIQTHQTATGSTGRVNGSLVGIVGSAEQDYSYRDSDGFDFHRTVSVYNRTVTKDHVSGSLKSQALPVVAGSGDDSQPRISV